MIVTIDGFESLTEQEVFDMSVKHVLANGKPSVTDNGGCVYGGIGCGAAPFIKPEHRESCDARQSDGESYWSTLVSEGIVSNHLECLIQFLQECHDEAAEEERETGEHFINLYVDKLENVVQEYNLSKDVLKEI